MSSHREAPEISKDPVADSTDVYAFVSPDRPESVTFIANFIPMELPDGDRTSTSSATTSATRSTSPTRARLPRTSRTVSTSTPSSVTNDVPLQHRTDPRLGDQTWNRPQFYTLTMIKDGHQTVLARHLPCPPVNVGKRSTPNYAHLAAQAQHEVGGRKVFAGQRADAFHVDLGSIFDLGALRPFNDAAPDPHACGHRCQLVAGLQRALDRSAGADPQLTRHGNHPTDVLSADSVIGVWATASRRKARVFDRPRASMPRPDPGCRSRAWATRCSTRSSSRWREKDYWNATPAERRQPVREVRAPPRAGRPLPILYPGVFPHLGRTRSRGRTCTPSCSPACRQVSIPGFQNYTGSTQADMLRLNVAIPPSSSPSDDGDPRGRPRRIPQRPASGRRCRHNRAAGHRRLTIPLVDTSYTPDAAASGVTDGTTNTNAKTKENFPYLGLPGGGYQTVPGTTKAS